MEAERVELGLHGGDGRFERGVLAGDEVFGGVHGVSFWAVQTRQHKRCVKRGVE